MKKLIFEGAKPETMLEISKWCATIFFFENKCRPNKTESLFALLE
jgi:hypothetical protein